MESHIIISYFLLYMDTLKQLGIRLKAARTEKHFTQEDLEELTGINARYISAIECGQINPTVSTLEQLATGLGIQLSDLFIFDKTEQPKQNNPFHVSLGYDTKLLKALSQYKPKHIKQVLKTALVILKELGYK